jgi:hypothetical protein
LQDKRDRECPRDGKEGVDGSSPSEGLRENPCNWDVLLPAPAAERLRGYQTGTGSGQAGTRGHERTFAAPLTIRAFAKTGTLGLHSPCKTAALVVKPETMASTSLAREGVRSQSLAGSKRGGIWTHFPDQLPYRFIEVRPLR